MHSRVCAAHIDPIEKKPLFHFFPGTLAFSVATAGCNVNCKFCQNWDISQSRPEQVRNTYLPPKELASLAQQNRCPAIAYTYSEPVVFYEYMRDAADAGHALGIKSVVVSGGYIQQDPLKKLCPGVDAIKVDLKAFSEKYYKEVVNGELKPVLEAIVTMRKLGMWTELVYLVVPTLNDSDAEFRALAQWVKVESGRGGSAALLAFLSAVPAEESSAHALGDAGTRESHCRRRGPPLRVFGQHPGTSRRKARIAPSAAVSSLNGLVSR